MHEDLIDKLRNGSVLRPKRWSGDTHDDLGGSVDEAATDAIMAEAAAALEAMRKNAERFNFRGIDDALFAVRESLWANIKRDTAAAIRARTDETVKTNARLIEAAPELLDALIDLLLDTQHSDHNCPDEHCPVARAKRAISKATGEPLPPNT